MVKTVEVALFLCFVQMQVSLGPISAQPTADEVKSLPGLSGPLSSKQYSGYLQASGTIRLHYWFVESQGKPAEDPVLLWLNGGPSCSSISGYLTELGPYWVNSDGKTLSANDFSWNKVANIIFLESPAGVGYSFADSPDYTTNDDKTAENNYLALLDFFKKFPNMAKNDFYITGESYAGIYVPTLAVKVMEGKDEINLKGFAVGNGVLDVALLTETGLQYSYYHGIIGERLWEKLQSSCCKNGACHYLHSKNPECIEAQNEAKYLLQHIGINPYDVTGDCEGSYSQDRNSFSMLSFLGVDSWANPSRSSPGLHSSFLPCVDTTRANSYMNLPQVRAALHIPSSVAQNWTTCNPPLAANYSKQYNSMRSQFKALLPRYRALVYNGDADNICNFLSDQKFVASLNQTELGERRPWVYQGQVAGFVKEYKQVTFMTVKNSGHLVPEITPGPALQMITNFLKAKPQ
ncbi:lysosomal protective protein-like [Acanthaster planci]|uniref:Carboxypeptidase n=1 Tax=Acanthaster planci TaxID=133434 RepID=A0A8B7ZRP4_ACAPL|nr:lysosomal protective protein-like [Acanthaster planci]